MDWGLILIVAGVVVGVILTAFEKRDINRAWKEVARELDLSFQAGNIFSTPRMYGSYSGCSVSVTTVTRGRRNNQTTCTRYEAQYAQPLGLGLRLTGENAFSSLAWFFGAQDIEVGDKGFDHDFVVKGADSQTVREFLTPSRMLSVRRFLEAYPDSSIDDNGVQWVHAGEDLDIKTVRRLLDRLTTLAGHMVCDRAGDESIGLAFEARQEGRLAEALELVRNIADESQPDLQDVRVLEGEILYAAGQAQEAVRVLESVSREAPEDSALRDFLNVATTRTRANPPAEETEHSRSADVVSADLFDQKNPDSKTNELFDIRYRGRNVQWKGLLDNVRSYVFDQVFGGDPGIRAVFEVHELVGNPYGRRTVQAVVQLPADVEQELRSRIGTTVEFEGTLVSCDPFMRNIFVSGGELIDS